jgi:hypothetical protein
MIIQLMFTIITKPNHMESTIVSMEIMFNTLETNMDNIIKKLINKMNNSHIKTKEALILEIVNMLGRIKY